jgi:hypothetical protein
MEVYHFFFSIFDGLFHNLLKRTGKRGSKIFLVLPEQSIFVVMALFLQEAILSFDVSILILFFMAKRNCTVNVSTFCIFHQETFGQGQC